MCFEFVYKFCQKHISLQDEFREVLLQFQVGLHVMYRLFLLILMKFNFSGEVLGEVKEGVSECKSRLLLNH
jgi:hypothetical protein